MRFWLLLLLYFLEDAIAKRGGGFGGGRGFSGARSSSGGRGGGRGFGGVKSFFTGKAAYSSKVSSSSGRTFYRGSPIYTSRSSFLIINSHHYYWTASSYRTSAERPVNCEVKFDASDELLSDIYVHDYKNETYVVNGTVYSTDTDEVLDTLNKTNMRPEKVFFNCPKTHYCCDSTCCDKEQRVFKWILICGGVFVLVLIIWKWNKFKDINVIDTSRPKPKPVPDETTNKYTKVPSNEKDDAVEMTGFKKKLEV